MKNYSPIKDNQIPEFQEFHLKKSSWVLLKFRSVKSI